MLPPAGRLVDRDDLVRPRPARIGRPPRREIVAVLAPRWAEGSAVTPSALPPAEVLESAARDLSRHLRPDELVTVLPDGRLALRLRRDDRSARPVRLQAMAYHAIEVLSALAPGDAGLLDLGVGWAPVNRRLSPVAALDEATDAAEESVRQRDMQPRATPSARRSRTPRITRWSTGHQILWATVGTVGAGFLGLVATSLVGLDLSSGLYWALVVSLLVTAVTIWAESAAAFDPPRLPPRPETPAPRATAVVAAYLPNEADTILETLRVFLAHDYPGGLQVLLAYNSPTPLAVEVELHAMAESEPDLTVIRVPDSTSKAQNVNAALRVAEGEIVGVFDADHHPADGAFERAWHWLAEEADVVQGHCVIRNGGTNWLTRLVAVEFEQIYAVAHPGRAQLHGFGIFGGSNGFWRASALEQVRLRGSFLTEDIEASMRVLAAGGRIVSDPGLVSRELAPETLRQLWKQRMRWAQGWFQVSCRHLRPVLSSPLLSARQKLGATYLMGWRELYPWIAMATWPLLAFLAWRDGGIDMTSPIFALLTLVVTVSGPVQTLAAWRLAAPEIRQHPRWFAYALVGNLLGYTAFKNLVNRVAHLKQLRGEHQWVVTPRTAGNHTADDTDTDTETPIEEAA
ncbi:glycosyltransferase family 2 protein [uncultured Nocardioides sp.]|uniref:glycosyltransferase n=1 Tax=uncultured Nocardioides sp. TaxID=198441 RepID=UPI002624A7C7|nr:glycosyltransferase family 2 protein [uncultured Nocardioides sp.]